MSIDRRLSRLESLTPNVVEQYGDGIRRALAPFIALPDDERADPDTFPRLLAEVWGCSRAEADRRYQTWGEQIAEQIPPGDREDVLRRLAEVDANS